MSEAGHGSVVEETGHGVPVRTGLGEPAGPLGHPVRDDIPVKIGIKERTAIVPPPAVGMQAGDGRRVVRGRLTVLQARFHAISHGRTGNG